MGKRIDEEYLDNIDIDIMGMALVAAYYLAQLDVSEALYDFRNTDIRRIL
jgi:hypothetical protein